MSAAVCVFVLTLLALCGDTVVSGAISRPTNVYLSSYNMDLVLRWDPPKGAPSGLLYTTEYRARPNDYRAGCVNTSLLQCDLTGFHISEYGEYTSRVRAQLGGESSDWVVSESLTLDRDTIIGSPNVSLFSNEGSIEVSIQDPVFKISTLREVYSSSTYNITYWADGQRNKARSMSKVKQSRVVLHDLDLWTKYCVHVQIITGRSRHPSEPSEAVCESTTSKEKTPWVAAVATFVVMAMVVALVVAAVIYQKRISNLFCPKDPLSNKIKRSFLEPMYIDMQSSQPPEEIYDQVRVEEGLPTAEGAESSCSTQPDVTVGLEEVEDSGKG